MVTTLVSLLALVASAASSAVAPAVSQIATDLHITSTVDQALVFSIYNLGYVVGSLPYGPLSELYGRRPVLHMSFAFFLVFNIASGFAQTYPQLLIFRFLSGVGGIAPNTVSGNHILI